MDSVVVLSDKVLDPDIIRIALLSMLHMLIVSSRRYDSYFDCCAALGVGLGAHRLILCLGLVKAL